LKFLEIIEKWNWVLKVLEFDVRGPGKSLIVNTIRIINCHIVIIASDFYVNNYV